MQISLDQIVIPDKKLGKGAAKPGPKQLHLSNYLKAAVTIPEVYNFWKGKVPFVPYNVGNNEIGDCGIASEALLAQRMERIEQNRTIQIPKDNIVKAYFDLTARLYGGGDTGIYETDGLDQWRKPDLTFRDSKGRPHTIDAYTKINQANLLELKTALFLSGAHGIKICFNLPWAWSQTNDWDIPEGQLPIGEYAPGSWGGHSMMADATWDKNWLTLPSSWNQPAGRVSWRAILIYCDEANLCIDSINAWKKKTAAKIIDLKKLTADVNMVSSQKIKNAS